ncbi:MAG: hypothetical protein JNM78_13350 [Cyclobacteriaceae bacterium]|nr:hypothetical protein [Cyclobacteriaceae bacterium]
MADNLKKDTEVTITVDTGSVNETNKNSKIIFSDDRSDPAENPGDPANYVSTVSSTKKVTYKAVVKDPASYPHDSVAVKKVYKKAEGGGVEILKKDSYTDTNNNGVVVCQVRDNKITGTENYTVTVAVTTTRGSDGSYVTGTNIYDVDPKLQMNT